MKKYKVSLVNVNGVKCQETFEKEKVMLSFIKLAFRFGIKSLNVEQFEVTENE